MADLLLAGQLWRGQHSYVSRPGEV